VQDPAPSVDDGPPEDPFADLRADVATYAHADPLVTLRGLSDASGIPVVALVRYVLARWASGGSEGLLELGVSGVDHLVRILDDAEAAGTDAARLEAYHAVRGVVGWLRAGLDEPDAGPAGPDEPGATG
jgi:hypothetical protein